MSTEQQQRQEVKIQELLTKLQVLTNGLIEERKKSQNYLNKIKEFESILSKKDNEIIDLSKDKYDWISKINIEKSKQSKRGSSFSDWFDNIFNKDKVDPVQVNKLTQQNVTLSEEIQRVNQQIVEGHELYDQQKIKFQTEITIQNSKIKEMTENYKNTQKEYQSWYSKNEELLKELETYEHEKAQFDELISKEQKVMKEQESLAAQYNDELRKTDKEIFEKKDEIKALKKSKFELSKKMTELKSWMTQIWEVKKYKAKTKDEGLFGGKKIVEIVIGKNEERNCYEIIMKDEKQNMAINLLNINSVEISEKKENCVEISYIDSGKSNKIFLEFHEWLTENFIETYRAFNTKANMEEFKI